MEFQNSKDKISQGQHVKEITSNDWEVEVDRSNLPVFVDFWAPWCDSCRKVDPIVESIADEYFDKMRFVKVNVDQDIDLASKYNIFGKPTMTIFSKGSVISQQVGVPMNAKESLKTMIEKVLKNPG